jgi:predicted transposase YdaD
MDPAKYAYQSEFAKRFVAQGEAKGREEGEASGRAAMVMKLLALRFGPLPDAVQARISETPIAELDAIGERLLTAQNLQEALGAH